MMRHRVPCCPLNATMEEVRHVAERATVAPDHLRNRRARLFDGLVSSGVLRCNQPVEERTCAKRP